MNLRYQAEADLAETLEGDWGLPVMIISADGFIQSLDGQILYDTTGVNPETGMPVIVHKPVVTIRRSSMTRVPAAGEKWAVRIPVDPTEGARLDTFLLARPLDCSSLGIVKLYLTKAEEAAS